MRVRHGLGDRQAFQHQAPRSRSIGARDTKREGERHRRDTVASMSVRHAADDRSGLERWHLKIGRPKLTIRNVTRLV